MSRKRVAKPGARMQRGQILVLVVFAIVGLVAFAGLVIDTGLVFINYGALRRSVDAASLAAAAQYRKSPDVSGLDKAAKEFLVLNNVSDPSAEVFVCKPGDSHHELDLCTQPARRRLVKVNATSKVKLAFLPVIGIKFVTLHATATAEAASLDIVLLLDVSESMTFDSAQTDILLDPAECNKVPSGDLTKCRPFKDIQASAQQFVEGLFPADGSNVYDRIAVIAFDRSVHDPNPPNNDTYDLPLHLSDAAGKSGTEYRQAILDAIANLRVYTASKQSTGNPLSAGSCLNSNGDVSYPTDSTCRSYPENSSPYCFADTTGLIPLGMDLVPPDESVFDDKNCFTLTGDPLNNPPDPLMDYLRPSTGKYYTRAFNHFICPPGTDPRYCGTTNIGEALYEAGREFALQPGMRQESLWAVILLTDGITNHSKGDRYCPNGIGTDCQDATSATRHCLPSGDPLYAGNAFLYNVCHSTPPDGGGGTVNFDAYDADDYARDMADFVSVGQQALVYTIGFGDALGHCATPPCDPTKDRGEQLLNFAADIGDNGKIEGGINSNYFWTHDATALKAIFDEISSRIATRLAH